MIRKRWFFLAWISLFFLSVSLVSYPSLVMTLAQEVTGPAVSHRMMDVIVPECGDWEIQNRIEKDRVIMKISRKVTDRMLRDVSAAQSWTPVDLKMEMDQLGSMIVEVEKDNLKDHDRFVSDLSVRGTDAAAAINGMAEGICQWMASFPAVRALMTFYRVLVSFPFILGMTVLFSVSLYRMYRTEQMRLLRHCALLFLSCGAVLCCLILPAPSVFLRLSSVLAGRAMTLDLTVCHAGIVVLLLGGTVLLLISHHKTETVE